MPPVVGKNDGDVVEGSIDSVDRVGVSDGDEDSTGNELGPCVGIIVGTSDDIIALGDNEGIARLALRYILCNPAITAPIPGLISPQQVDNAALAVVERRELDVDERAELDRAMDDAWARLPHHYQWLKDWEYV